MSTAKAVKQSPDSNADVTSMTYEQARTALGEIVTKLEAGGTTLDESLGLWQRGEAIADVCERLLRGAQEKLDATLASRTE